MARLDVNHVIKFQRRDSFEGFWDKGHDDIDKVMMYSRG